jgi:RNA polymerase sigma-70 factor (ECF subfamily)
MKPWDDLSDEELAQKVQQGYQAAFNELVERYTAKVYLQARAMTRSGQEAEDIVQETFLKAFKHIDKFSPAKATFKTWLFAIARNQSINVLNSLKRKMARYFYETGGRTEHDYPDPVAGLSDGSDAEKLLSEKQQFARVTQAIEKLPERQRTALLLKAQESMSYEEIAQVMQTSASAVESLIFRARKTLMDVLEE